MPKKKRNAHKSAASKLTPAGRAVVEGLKEAIAHVRGEIGLPTYHYPERVNVKAIRSRSGLSQAQFADRYGFSVRTLQEWELGRAQPPSAVRAYLTVIDRNPRAVEAALGGKTAT